MRAIELIKNGISISDTANLTGFDDYNYFTKVVKKKPVFCQAIGLANKLF